MKKSILIVLGLLLTTAGFSHQQPVKKKNHWKHHHSESHCRWGYCKHQPRVAVWQNHVTYRHSGYYVYQPAWAVEHVRPAGPGGYYVYESRWVEPVRPFGLSFLFY